MLGDSFGRLCPFGMQTDLFYDVFIIQPFNLFSSFISV